jgi:hypothetical protein
MLAKKYKLTTQITFGRLILNTAANDRVNDVAVCVGFIHHYKTLICQHLKIESLLMIIDVGRHIF